MRIEMNLHDQRSAFRVLLCQLFSGGEAGIPRVSHLSALFPFRIAFQASMYLSEAAMTCETRFFSSLYVGRML